MLVYKSTNSVTGRLYIGSTTGTLGSRSRQHKSSAKHGSNLYFHKSVRKHGFEVFTWEVLCTCESKEEMLEMEYHYIKQYGSLAPCGYNSTEGYEGTTLGFKFSEEHKKAQSSRMLGSNNPNFGIKWTTEQKKALSTKKKGLNTGATNPSKRQDVRDKIRLSKLGVKNHASAEWCLTSPEGIKTTFIGGIKSKLRELGLSYDGYTCSKRNGHPLYKGWSIEKVVNN